MAKAKKTISSATKRVAGVQARTRKLTGLPKSASDISGFLKGIGSSGVTPKVAKKIGGTKGQRFSVLRKQAATKLRKARAAQPPRITKPKKGPPSRVTIKGPDALKKAKGIALKRAKKGLGTKITRLVKAKAIPKVVETGKTSAFQKIIKRLRK